MWVDTASLILSMIQRFEGLLQRGTYFCLCHSMSREASHLESFAQGWDLATDRVEK